MVGNFSQLHQFEFGGAPLEVLHRFGGSGARSMVLVEQIHGGAAGAGTVWLGKVDPDLDLVNLELVELSQTGPMNSPLLLPIPNLRAKEP